MMMAETRVIAHREVAIGDAAVDGLLAGIGAGLLMSAYLILAAWGAGEDLGAVLSRFDPNPDASPLTGTLMHLAVAGVYGIVFGLARRFSPRRWQRVPSWFAGLVYGWLLVLLAWGVVLPGAASPLLDMGFARLAGAHAVYGLALGILLDRTMAATARS
jgi:hypothetical protein